MQSSTGDADEASDRDSDSNEIVKEFNHINKRLAEEIHAKQAQSLSSLLSSAQAKDEEITEVLSDMDDDTLSSQISHEDGRNVLHYLTKYNGARVSILQTILKRAPSLANKALKTSGLLPLHILCRYFPNETQSLEILLQASPASAAMPEAEGCLPLHFACAAGASSKAIKKLLAYNEDAAKVQDTAGWLPLHYFAFSLNGTDDDVQTLQILKSSYPAAVFTVNADGKLPVDCLAENHRANEECLRILLECD
uniref:Uncharacterized protein n=1 Tax=Hanusia phi TaxID=3032 RepID=A0A7S0EMJ6_9CRYP|mmetsp:Transcript_26475/g.60305  ORF Transcript_26475/g.60305 Transcript_26475/m.60305 type:complete len:252 (+) Transcript_26475:113-868(+)